MTQQEQILLMDLGARLQYGVKIKIGNYSDYVLQGINPNKTHPITVRLIEGEHEYDIEVSVNNIKPYLRSLSSMTDDELKYIKNIFNYEGTCDCFLASIRIGKLIDLKYNSLIIFLISHHFDYQGFIPMGLALEAPKGMYEI